MRGCPPVRGDHREPDRRRHIRPLLESQTQHSVNALYVDHVEFERLVTSRVRGPRPVRLAQHQKTVDVSSHPPRCRPCLESLDVGTDRRAVCLSPLRQGCAVSSGELAGTLWIVERIDLRLAPA